MIDRELIIDIILNVIVLGMAYGLLILFAKALNWYYDYLGY